LDDLADEVRVAYSMLAALPEYTHLWGVVNSDPNVSNKISSFVELVVQVTEDKALSAMEASLFSQGVQVDVLMPGGVGGRAAVDVPVDATMLTIAVSVSVQIPLVVRERPFTLDWCDLRVLHPDDLQPLMDVSGLSLEHQDDLLAVARMPDLWSCMNPLLCKRPCLT
jgi:hypothetical protein